MHSRRVISRTRQIGLLAFGVFLGVVGGVWGQSTGWYDPSWSERQEINIDSSLTATDLDDFPFLVRILGADAVFTTAQADGDDILFTRSDGVTKIPHEIEFYEDNAGSEALYAWVQVPTISAGADTTIYMYYGNPASTNQEETASVWDADYALVMHLNETVADEGTTGIHFDSTLNSANGVQSGNATATGIIANGQTFDGTDDYIEVDNIDSDLWTAVTISAWFNSGSPGTEQFAVSKNAGGGGPAAAIFQLGITGGNLAMRVATDGQTSGDFDEANTLAIAAATDYFVAGTFDVANATSGNPDAYLYRGTGGTTTFTSDLEDTVPGAGGATLKNGIDEGVVLGLNQAGGNRPFDGLIDEVRISRVARSADWLEAEFLNMDDPEGTLDATNPRTRQRYISGTVFTDIGLTPAASGVLVALSIDGGTTLGTDLFTTTTTAGGNYFIAVPAASLTAGSRVAVFRDDNNAQNAGDGAVVTVSDGENLTGLDLYQDAVIVRHDNGASLTNADLTAADNGDADLPFAVASGNLTIPSGWDLVIPTGATFAPGGTVTVGTADDGTSDIVAHGTLILGGNATAGGGVRGSGTLTVGANTLEADAGVSVSSLSMTSGQVTITGEWSVASLTAGTGTISFDGTGELPGGSYPNLALTAGTLSLTGNVTVSSGVTLTSGTLSPGPYTHSIAGGWDDTGIAFAPNGGTIRMTGTPALSQGVANRFHNLILANGATTTTNITVGGDLTIVTGVLNGADDTINLVGDWTNLVGASGYTPGTTGEVRFFSNARDSTITGETTFWNLTIDGEGAADRGKTVRFDTADTLTVSNVFSARGNLTASNDVSYVTIQSTTPGVQATLDINEAAEDFDYLIVQDLNAINAAVDTLVATNSLNGGNNSAAWDIQNGATDVEVWTGATDTQFYDNNIDGDTGSDATGNWQNGIGPSGDIDTVTIPAAPANQPALNDDFNDTGITVVVLPGAVWTLGTFQAYLENIENQGTVRIDPSRGWVDSGNVPNDNDSGLFEYYGTSGAIYRDTLDSQTPAGRDNRYYNLRLTGSGLTFYLNDGGEDFGIIVNNDVTIDAATFDADDTGAGAAGDDSLTVTRDMIFQNSGSFRSRSATHSIGGSVSGNGTFNVDTGTVTVGDAFLPSSVEAGAGSSLTVTGDWAPGSYSLTNGTVTFDAGGSISGGAFNNLTVSTGRRTATGNITINGDLIVNGTLDMGAHNLTVSGTVSGTGTLISGSGNVTANSTAASAFAIETFQDSTGTVTVRGGWDVGGTTGSYEPGTSTVIFAGPSAALERSTEFFNLTIDSGAVFTTAANSVFITNIFNNNGEIRRNGDSTINQTDPDSGLTTYISAGAIQNYSDPDYFDLAIDATGETLHTTGYTLAANDITIVNGTIEARHTIAFFRNWDNQVGTGGYVTDGDPRAVVTRDASTVSTIFGDTNFSQLRINRPGKVVEFESGTTQGVAQLFEAIGEPGNPVVLRGTTAVQWSINATGTAGTERVEYADIRDSNNVSAGRDLTAFRSVDSGNNDNGTGTPEWIFTGETYTWTGATSSNWATATNWLPNGTPGPNDSVVIPDAATTANDPDLQTDTTDRTVIDLTVETGGILDVGAQTLTITGTFENQGILRRHGVANASDNRVTQTDTDSGTTVYDVFGGARVQDYGAVDYHNLELDTTTFVTERNLSVAGTLSITNDGGLALSTNNNSLSIADDLTVVAGGSFSAGPNVFFVDATQVSTISGDNTFTNLSISAPGKTVQFTDGSTQEVTGLFTVQGTSSNNVILEGTGTGGWTITDSGTEDVDFARVAYSTATNGITANSSIDLGNNTNWTFVGGAGFFTWTGTASTTWEDAANWSGTNLSGDLWPDAGEIAVIPDVSGGSGNFPVLTGTLSIENLTIQSGASLDTGGNTLTITGEYDNAGTLFRRGGDSVTQTDTTSGTTHYRTTAGAIQDYGSGSDYFNLIVDGAAFTMGSALRVAGDLTVTGAGTGSLDTGFNTLAVDGNLAGTGSLVTGLAEVTVAGDWTIDGFTSGGGRVTLSGTDVPPDSLGAATFDDLRLSGGTRILAGAVTVRGDLLLAGGDLQLGANTLTLHGNFTPTAGALTPGTGSIDFANSALTSTISGSNTFYGFTSSAGGKTIRFTNGTTQTIAAGGTFNVQGSGAALPITLESTTAGSQWALDLSAAGIVTGDYLVVEDSDLLGATPAPFTAVTPGGFSQGGGANNDTTATGAGDPADPTNDDARWDFTQRTLVLSRTTLDQDGNGQIDTIRIVTDQTLNDNFTGTTVAVVGYTVSSVTTGTTATDDTFDVNLTESGALDTGATPAVEITAAGSLTGGGVALATDAAPVTPLDGAAPALVSVTLADGGGGAGIQANDTVTFVYAEPLDPTSISAALISGNTNNALAVGSGSIQGTFADLVAELGSFAVTGNVSTLGDSTLTMPSAATVVITLGTVISGSVEPSGDFTPSVSYRDAAGNLVISTLAQTATGTFATGGAIAYTWDNGGTGTDWGTPENWNPSGVPGAIDSVTIPDGSPFVVTLAGDQSITNVTIEGDATLSLGAGNLTMTGILTNVGTLQLSGTGSVTGATSLQNTGTVQIASSGTINVTDTDSGTFEYTGAGPQNIIEFGATDYFNLTVSGTTQLTAATAVAGDLSSTGSLALGANPLTITGNLSTGTGGTVTQGTGTITVTGTTTIDSGAATDVVLSTAGNTFTGTIQAVSGNNVTINDSNATEILASDTTGTFTVASGGNITVSGAIGGNTPGGGVSLNANAGASSINLNADVLTDENDVTLTGDVVAGGVISIDTEAGDDGAAGQVTITGTLDGQTAGIDSFAIDARGAPDNNATISGATGATTQFLNVLINGAIVSVGDFGDADPAGAALVNNSIGASDRIIFTGTTYKTEGTAAFVAPTDTADPRYRMTAGAPVTFDTNGGSIQFTDGAAIDGTILLANGSNLSIVSSGGAIDIPGGIRGTSQETVSINTGAGVTATETVTLGAVGSGNEILSVAVTAQDGITLNGDIFTNGGATADITMTGPVTVGADITLDTDATGEGVATAAGDILFSSTVDGGFGLTLDASEDGAAAAGTATVTGVTGGTTNLTGFTVAGATQVDVESITVDGAASAIGIAITGDNIDLNGTGYTVVNGTGDDPITLTGAVDLHADVTITGGGATGDTVSVAGTGTVDADDATAANRALTIAAGAADLSIGAAAGGTQALAGGITLTGAAISTGAITTTPAQADTNAGGVSLTGTGAVTVSGGITATGGVASAGNPGGTGGAIALSGDTVSTQSITATGGSGAAGTDGGAGGGITLTATGGAPLITLGGAVQSEGGAAGSGATGAGGLLTINDTATTSSPVTVGSVSITAGTTTLAGATLTTTTGDLTIAVGATLDLDAAIAATTVNVVDAATLANNGTIRVANDTNLVTIAETSGVGAITFTGNDIDYNGAGTGGAITLGGISSYGPAAALGDGESITLSAPVTFAGGLSADGAGAAVNPTVTTGANPLTTTTLTVINGATLDASGGGAVTASGNVDFVDTTNGTFTKDGGGAAIFTFNGGAAQSVWSGGNDLGDIRLSAAGTNLTLEDAGNFDDVTVDAGTTLTSAQDFSVGGAFASAGTLALTAGTTTFDGTGAVTVATPATNTFRNVTINSAGTVTLGVAAGIAIEGDFTNTAGTFDATTNAATVELLNAALPSTVSGNTTFHTLTIDTPNKVVEFAATSEQTVIAALTFQGTAGNEVVLRSTNTGVDQWQLNIADAVTPTVDFINLADSDLTQTSTPRLFAIANAINGGNNDQSDGDGDDGWGFSAQAYTWTGVGGDGLWETDLNWSPVGVPGAPDSATVPDGGGFVVQLSADRSVSNVTVGGNGDGDDAILDLNTFNFSVSGSFANGGTLRLAGPVGQTVNLNLGGAAVPGTVEYDGGAGTPVLGGLYTNLIIAGTLDMGGADLTVSGDYTNSGSYVSGLNTTTFNAGSGTATIQTGGAAPTQDFQDLTFDDGGGGTSFVLVGALDVDGALTVTGGTLQTGANPVTVAGNLAGGGSATAGGGLVSVDGNLSVATFTAGAGNVDVAGSITSTSFTASSNTTFVGANLQPTTFTANGGTVELDGGTAAAVDGFTFNNLTIDKSAAGVVVTSGAAWTVGGVLALTQGTWDAGTFTHNIAGNWDGSAPNFVFTEDTSTIRLTSDGANVTTKGAADPFANLTIASGTIGSGVTFQSETTVSGLTTAQGRLNSAGLELNLGNLTLNGDTLIDTTNGGGETAGATITLGAVTSAANPLELNAGTGGNVLATSFAGAGDLTITNSNNTTVSGGVTAGAITLTDSNGTVSLHGVVNATSLTTAAQPYNLSILGAGSIIGGDTDLINTGTLQLGNAGTDTVQFTGGLGATSASSIDVAGTVSTVDAQMDIGAVTLTADSVLDTGTAGASALNVGAVSSGGFQLTLDSGPNAALVLASFAGGGDLVVRDANGGTLGSAGAVTLAAFTLQDSTTALALGNPLTASGAIDLQAGAFSMGGNPITVAGDWTVGPLVNFLNTNQPITFNASTAPQTITTNGTAADKDYYDVIIDTSGGFSAILSGNILVNRDLVFNAAAELNDGGNLIIVERNWDNSAGGTLTATGAVRFNNAAQTTQVLGSTPFRDLSVLDDGKIVQFESGQTQTVNGTLTVTGSAGAGNLITLEPTVAATDWRIDNVGNTENIQFAVVSYSDASLGAVVNATNSHDVQDGGASSNTNWDFGSSNLQWLGLTTDWNDANNWNNGYVPNPTDNVTIPDTGTAPNMPILDTAGEGDETNNLTLTDPSSSLTFIGPANDLTVTGTFTFDGTLNLEGDETLSASVAAGVAAAAAANRGTVVYGGQDATGLAAGSTYYNLQITANTYTLAADLTIEGSFAFSGGVLNAGAGPFNLTVHGEWTNSGGAYEPLANTTTFTGEDGAGPFLIRTGGTAAGQQFNNLTFDSPTNDRVFILENNALATTGGIVISAGDTLDAETGTGGPHNLLVGGDWANAGTYLSGANTTSFTGAGGAGPYTINSGGTGANQDFYRVVIGSAANQTYRLASNDLLVEEDLTIDAGDTLDAENGAGGPHNITVGQDYTNNGAFVSGAATVTFDGRTGGGPFLINTGGTGANNDFGNVVFGAGSDLVYRLTGNSLAAAASVTIDTGDELDVQGFSLTAALLNNNGTLRREGSGEVVPRDADSGLVIYDGAGGTIQNYDDISADYFDLQIGANQSIAGGELIQTTQDLIASAGTLSLTGDILTGRDLVISAGGSINGGGSSLQIGRNWTNGAGVGGFVAGTSTVEFVAPATSIIQVTGSTDFYNLERNTGNIVIEFGAGETFGITPGGSLIMTGTGPGDIESRLAVDFLPPGPAWEGQITMTTTDPGLAPPPPNPAPSQWIFDPDSSFSLTMQYAVVAYSYSTLSVVVPPLNILDPNTFNWLTFMFVDSSETIDNDGNGRIDQIRVTLPVNHNSDFSDIEVTVSGYTVASVGPAVAPNDFIINIVEGSGLDTDATPSWLIDENRQLRDQYSGTRIVAISTPTAVPNDAAAPIAAHTLAYAGGDQIFVRFSEPVFQIQPGTPVASGDFTIGGGTPPNVTAVIGVDTAGSGMESLLLALDRPLGLADLGPPVPLTINAGVEDAADLPLVDTDISISSLSLSTGTTPLTTPVYAVDETITDPVAGGLGIIREFDGSAFLTPETITMQVFREAGLPAPDLLYQSGVPATAAPNGIWLPFELPGLTLDPYLAPLPAIAGTAVSAQLTEFTLPSTDARITENVTLEFLLDTGLTTEISGSTQSYYAARIDTDNGEPWYDSVRPFAFDLQNLVVQRGGVTIANNVIDPTAGERATLNYTLDSRQLVRVYVLDLAGALVKTVQNGIQNPGEYSLAWDGTNREGRPVATGVYFVRVVAGELDEIRKVLVVRE